MNPNLDVENQSLTFRVAGDLLSTNAEAVRGEIGKWLEGSGGGPQKWNTFVLDLRAAKMVDSVGLNLVVSLFKRVQKLGGKMQIAYSAQNVLRTFTFTRLDKYVELVKA